MKVQTSWVENQKPCQHHYWRSSINGSESSQTAKHQSPATARPAKGKAAVQSTSGGKATVGESSGSDSSEVSEDSESEETPPQKIPVTPKANHVPAAKVKAGSAVTPLTLNKKPAESSDSDSSSGREDESWSLLPQTTAATTKATPVKHPKPSSTAKTKATPTTPAKPVVAATPRKAPATAPATPKGKKVTTKDKTATKKAQASASSAKRKRCEEKPGDMPAMDKRKKPSPPQAETVLFLLLGEMSLTQTLTPNWMWRSGRNWHGNCQTLILPK
eukprot:XP_014067948.1 PREDICTED: proteoglycan 4-like [Salmo salar]